MSEYTDWVESILDRYAALLSTEGVDNYSHLIKIGEWQVVACGLIPHLINTDLLRPADYPAVLEWAAAGKFGPSSPGIARSVETSLHRALADVVMGTLSRVAPHEADRLRNPYDCGEPESVWFDGIFALAEQQVVLARQTISCLEAAVRTSPNLTGANTAVDALRSIAQATT